MMSPYTLLSAAPFVGSTGRKAMLLQNVLETPCPQASKSCQLQMGHMGDMKPL